MAEDSRTQKMPRPGAKEAPEFDTIKEDPRPYLKHLESLFDECKITDDNDKKKYTLRYLHEDVEEQWKYQEHYKEGTYSDWKKAILRSYTGAADEHRGTIAHLRRVMRKFADISINDQQEFAKMKREAQPIIAQVI
ncbi:hypothetical protein K435DRAFT_559776, partial [Dendrothele bispora CBS 962.96]